MQSRNSSRSRNGGIDKLDFDSHSHRQARSTNNDSGMSSPHELLRDDESLLSIVVDGVIERDRRKMKRAVIKYLSFASAMLSCLVGGSITAYSLYGHLFLSRLHYTQGQVNAVSITAALAMYLPVPLFGYLCDRYSPRPLALLSAVFFGVGYTLAAYTYRHGPPVGRGGQGWSSGVMVLAFVGVGLGTTCMYLSAVTTCAKNFGRGKHKGLALAMPIAAYGLSGMWLSQVGSQLLYEPISDGGKGDVDVFRFFIFLGCLTVAVGLIGATALKVVDEEELIDEAVDELERSGLLEESAFFQRSILHESNGYGTLDYDHRVSREEHDHLPREVLAAKAHDDEEEQRKKTWLLNGETRRFLADHTMWFLAAGFFLVTGPGEAFINNLGTIIGTLYPPPSSAPSSNSAATHISIIAITSTCTRLLTGTLSDILAPAPPPLFSTSAEPARPTKRFTISRIAFLLTSTLLLSIAQLLLASGLIQTHPSLFPLISALVGTGYGAVFSLTPIIVSVVWGVQNFGTNWGIVAMMPAGGAAVWGAVYSAVYMAGAERIGKGDGNRRGGGDGGGGGGGTLDDVLCYGNECYAATFWAMAVCSWVAVGLWGWAWRGKGGWLARGVAI
ncbi:putative monocarboxylate transporter mch1 [Schaereria dolodes]|nr:putative monocarboxylate transporter mch1 [Schaereria dolodes]